MPTAPRAAAARTAPSCRLADRVAAGAADRAPRRDAPPRRCGWAWSRYRTGDG